MENSKQDQEKESSNGASEKNPLEWVIFGLGALLVLLLLGYLTYMSVTKENTPPKLLVSAKRDSTELTVLRYAITVKNEGNETAADVVVKVKLKSGDTIREDGDLIFPFVPHTSQREGWYQFSEVPGNDDIVNLQVISYRKP